jgi:glycosyltransferase involved in cell wall biosynthesis
VKLAVVVQRYGPSINGGAELHARYVAERLARHAEVDVLTTCATDYVTWHDTLEPGVEQVNGVNVRRFRVGRERSPDEFSRCSERVFRQTHSVADELAWLDAEGPTSPALIRYVASRSREYDHCVLFSYRYYHAYHAARAAPEKAVLVPTAERDPAIGLSIFGPIFRGVRAIMFNSPEERAMIRAVAGIADDQPSVVVGVGSEVPSVTDPERFRRKFGLHEPFAVYVGRVDANKGCGELFDFFGSYLREGAGALTLVLIGQSVLDIPTHPRIRHLGFLDDRDKFDAIAGAELLIMPSYYESLSMVALEAWALGRPVLANGRCDVLKGQCIRSSAGLYYDGRLEFIETLRALERNRWLAATLGRNGRQFFREHYTWSVIERKYLEMFDRLSRAPVARVMEGTAGWFERRRPICPPSSEVVASLPAGPSIAPPSSPPDARATEPSPRLASGPPDPRSVSRSAGGHSRFRRGHHRSRRGGGSSASTRTQ